MASTVDLKNLTEYFDPEEELKSKIEELAGLFKAAKRVLFFTGAGISTSASIPDFRGPEGCWTNQALGKAPPKSISMIKAQPTECHMGIVACLQTKNSQPVGATIESTPASSSSPPSSSSSSSPSLSSSAALSPVWGRVVSQNIDGLHRRSGIAAKDISELHGNLFQEVCWGCQKSYLRTFEIKSGGRYAGGACPECTKRVPYFCHCTSRLCGACGGRLKDSIIHFKENLPAGEVTKAFRWADEADLCIVLGSSCTVSPACLVPKTVAKRGGHLVIVNLQKTPLDHLAKLRIFCKTDQFMRLFLAAAGVAPVAWDPAQDLVGEPCQVDDDEEDDADVPVEDIDSFFSSSAVTQAIAASGLPSSTTTPSTTASGSDGQTDGSSFITAPFEDLTDDQDKGGYVDPIKDCPHATNLATAPTLEAARALVEGHCHDCEEAKERWVCLHCLQARCGRYKQAHAVSHQGAHPDHAVALSLEDLTTWCYQCSSYILSEDTESLQLSFYVAKFGALPDGCSSDMST